MKPLAVDFVSASRWKERSLDVVLAVLLVLCIYEGVHLWSLQGKIAEKRSEVSSLQMAAHRREAERIEESARAQLLPPYYKDALAVSRMAAFPVGAVLTSVEVEPVPGIRLTLLEISAVDETARIELEFASHVALARYLERISEAAAPMSWTLVEATSGSTQGAPGVAKLALKVPARR